MVFPLGDLEKTRIIPVATYLLITLNIMAYFVELDRGETFKVSYAATPYEITHNIDLAEPIYQLGDDESSQMARKLSGLNDRPSIEQGPIAIPVWMTLFTCMFLHGSPLHLVGNMLYLWIFGDNVEEVLGTFRYVIIYLTCGVAGSLLQIAAAPDSMIPTLGASGAIAGVMGMYLIWFPHNRVRVLVLRFVTEMPAFVVIGLWIAIQLFEGYGALGSVGSSGGVAYLAHIGGALAGVGAALMFFDRARTVILQHSAYRWQDRSHY